MRLSKAAVAVFHLGRFYFRLLPLIAWALVWPVSPAHGQNQAKTSCEQLRNFIIPTAAIALPSAGARVRKATVAHSKEVEFCKVLGDIKPVDSTAQDIRFEINLPTNWNGKAVHFGGAIFDGSLAYSNGLKRPTIGLKDIPTPLQRGYLTFGSDAGHHMHHLLLPDAINILNSRFAANEEERRNFSQDALKKTHDVMVAVAVKRYGHAPTRNFFLGSSSGGHEALRVVQRWPDDYDGVMSGYPSWDGLELLMQFIRTSRALYTKGGFLPPSSTRLLAHAVLQACDSLAGVKDGLVSNVAACHFDPTVLLCQRGSRKGCLTPQQLSTVQTFATEQRTSMPVWQGVQSIPGYNVLAGADLTGTLGFFHHPEQHPKILLNASIYTIGSRIIRYFISNDQDFDALKLDTSTGAPFEKMIQTSSEQYDASDADLSRFASHGGKLILVHGTADAIIPTGSSVMYYQRVQANMGEVDTQKFLRLFLVPGFGHGTGAFLAGFDSLQALDQWVQSGSLPSDLTVEDKKRAGHGRTRPLCSYPTWPAYNGSGDPKLSQNFHCAQ